MPRTIFLAVALTAATAASAMAQQLYRWQWDGAIQILSQSAACNGHFGSDNNLRALYQPDLLKVNDRQSSLTIFRKTATEMIQNQSSSSGQFSGEGVYNWFTIADGEADQSSGWWEGVVGFQTFNFVQSPAVVDATTNFITIRGQLRDYAGIENCTVTLRGSFVAMDSEEASPPPPPAY